MVQRSSSWDATSRVPAEQVRALTVSQLAAILRAPSMGADSWGESPLRWRWHRTVSQGQGRHREVRSGGSRRQTREPMNKKRI
jgi:hypothetical protein